jgi:hypothetical protein
MAAVATLNPIATEKSSVRTANVSDPEHVDHGEQRFHGHLEHHRDREQSDRAADALLREIAMGVAAQGVAYGCE